MIGCVSCVINSEMQTFHYCMKQTPNPGFKTCFGEQALSMLRTFDDSSNITLGDGLVMVKDTRSMGRSLPDFLENPDPVDFRCVYTYEFVHFAYFKLCFLIMAFVFKNKNIFLSIKKSEHDIHISLPMF
jgi:hypothetical protein